MPDTPVEQPRVLTTLAVSLSAPAIEVGRTATASAAGFDQQGAAMTIGVPAWSSNQPAVAIVSANGVVTAVAPGEATVMARIGDVRGQLPLVVAPLPPGPAPVAMVQVSPQSASLEIGQTLQPAVTMRDAGGNILAGRSATWVSSAGSVATVSTKGLLAALATGTAIIEAASEGQRGALALTVTAALDTEVVVAIAVPTEQITVGDTMFVVATARSPAPITKVVASVGGQQAALTFGLIPPNGRAPVWFGTMNLTSLRFGRYDVVVTATDSRDHRGARSVTITRNPRAVGGTSSPPAGKQRRPAGPVIVP